ncbi:MAG: ornithine carbamoyltransferase [Saccharofermentans sp.]|jgi:ornithine carbamoyltransferase|nr:ornithine carbamoyltransferase [Mageeibacillus sp.]MCI1264442.1 ornithine carbamoyltransferase [Saccharofermentans sp.]MCI1275152.1 ornithine carbamoyltransferase [Saccharofermentans sp.]MCI1768809.1 ornithine carbamoyltransferase [Mageeibacillus sp.]
MKHFIDFHEDVGIDELNYLLDIASDMKAKTKAGIEHHYLNGKTLAMIFTKSSTRTRVSFEVGMYQLGGHSLFLSNNDIQIGRGETIHDTAKVLSGMVDGIMIRTFKHSDVTDLAKYGTIPVINGLTDDQHPTQMLADLLTIKEHKGTLKGLKLAYVGDGNNVANSLLQACSKAGMDIAIGSPKDYTCPDKYVKQAQEDAAVTGSKILMTDDPFEAASDADVIYTDTWTSMGQEDEKAKRVQIFRNYQVNTKLMGVAHKDAIFLHCLPAYRGYEVTEDVIDGPASVVFDEAENRLHAHKAILVNCYLNS